MRTVGALALALSLFASTAFAEKLLRPVSVQEARWSALQAAGVQNVWRGGHHVTQVGITTKGDAIFMVKSSDLAKPAIVSSRVVRETSDNYSYLTVKSTVLTPKQIGKLGLVSPSKALRTALENGGVFGSVKGDTKFAGASNKGQAYKLVVTPKNPVEVKVPYGIYTVTELTRYVNVRGRGESAQPTGDSKFKYQPR